MCRRVLELLAGRPQPSVGAHNRNHVVIRADKTLEFDLQTLPVLTDALEEATDGVAAVEVAAVREILGRMPLDLLVNSRQDARQVTPPESGIQAGDDIGT